MNFPVKIVGCVVDVHNLTMYKADGDTIVIPQGDPRVKDLVAKLVPAMDSQKPVAERFYMLDSLDMQDKNHFSEAEKKMNGVVRFFKMVKSKAKELLDKFIEPVEPLELGTKKEQVLVHTVTNPETGEIAPLVPEVEPVVERVLPPEDQRPLTRSEAAVAEIMAAATPSSDNKFSIPDIKGEEETTVIAVLPDNTIIPGCEALVDQAQAVAEGISSGTGMENFMRRAGLIKRGHSVEDLLKFIQKGELPIADDGCVLVYKLLNRTEVEGEFVDCHSGRVKQRVGSRVHMAEHMVDPNRGQDCSNGLHVARRDYLRSFGGNVCVLAKLAPEDVIAVPQYDARKLRAKGYHIIAELTDSDRRRVCQDMPMEDQVLLGNAIAGNHAGITEYVEITESKGGGLVVTKVSDAVEGMPTLDPELKGTSLDHLPTDGFDVERNSVDARALALETSAQLPVVDTRSVGMPAEMDAPYGEPVKETVSDSPATPVLPVKVQQARPVDLLVQNFNLTLGLSEARALLEFKKLAKKSWTALGVDIKVWEKAASMVAAADAPAVVEPVPPLMEVVTGVKVKAPAPKKATLNPLASAVLGAAKPSAVKKAPAKPKLAAKAATPKRKAELDQLAAIQPKAVKMTQQEQMAKLVALYEKNPDKQNAKEIFAFKQKSKKSWEVLGVTDVKFQKKITERAKL